MEDFVDSCPQNITAVLESSTRLGCGQDKYGNDQYICVPNIEKTGLIELCYNGIMGIIERGNCLRTTGGQLYRTSCLGFSSGCPEEEYKSNKIYKYPSCQSINKQHGCYFAESSCPNAMEDITTRDTTETSTLGLSTNLSIYNTTTMILKESTPLPQDEDNYTAVVVGSLIGVVLIIVLLVLAIILWKKKCRKKKREKELTSVEGEMFLPEKGIDTSGTGKVQETGVNTRQEERDHDETEGGVIDGTTEADSASQMIPISITVDEELANELTQNNITTQYEGENDIPTVSTYECSLHSRRDNNVDATAKFLETGVNIGQEERVHVVTEACVVDSTTEANSSSQTIPTCITDDETTIKESGIGDINTQEQNENEDKDEAHANYTVTVLEPEGSPLTTSEDTLKKHETVENSVPKKREFGVTVADVNDSDTGSLLKRPTERISRSRRALRQLLHALGDYNLWKTKLSDQFLTLTDDEVSVLFCFLCSDSGPPDFTDTKWLDMLNEIRQKVYSKGREYGKVDPVTSEEAQQTLDRLKSRDFLWEDQDKIKEDIKDETMYKIASSDRYIPFYYSSYDTASVYLRSNRYSRKPGEKCVISGYRDYLLILRLQMNILTHVTMEDTTIYEIYQILNVPKNILKDSKGKREEFLMDLRKGGEAVHYRGRSQDSVQHVTWLWRYGKPDIVISCIGLHPHNDIYIIDNKAYSKPNKYHNYSPDVKCLLYCLLLADKYQLNVNEQSNKITRDKIKDRYFTDLTDDGSVILPDGITETHDGVIMFLSDDIRHSVMYGFVTECLVKDSDLEFFLTTASRDVISEYCRSWGYKRNEEERCLYVPGRPEKMYDLFVEKLHLDIITHCTVSDRSIHNSISQRLGVPEEILQWDQEARKRYVEYAKRGTQTVHHARGMIVGCAGAGKTTLLKRLLGCSEKEIQEVESTEGLEVHEEIFEVCDDTKSLKARTKNKGDKNGEISARNVDAKTLSFFDFGGQCAYYACHQIYLTRRAFYVVVVDASKPLDQKVDKKVCDQDGSVFSGWTYGDYFVFWIKSIHTYCGSENEKDPKPIVLIIATHWEEENRQYQDKDALLYRLQQQLPKESNLSQYVVENNFYCTQFPVQTLHDLEERVFDIASHQRWKENIPKEWAFFDIEINQKKHSRRILDIEKLTTKLADNIDVKQENPERKLKMKKDMLRYYHDAGKVLYFNETKLQQYVIIDVQWFIDAFKHIITDKLHFKGIAACLEDWDEYYKTGNLTNRLLTEIWKREDESLPEEFVNVEILIEFGGSPRYLLSHKELLLSFMQRLGLMAVGKESHYVPCMNRKEIETAIPDLIHRSESKSSVLIYRFSLLPYFLFFRLVVSCKQLRGWKVLVTDETSCLYRNAALFSVHKYNVVLSVTDTSIQVQVVHPVPGCSLEKDKTYNIQSTIEGILNEISGTFHRNLLYERGFRCQEDCAQTIAMDIKGHFVLDKYIHEDEGDIICPLHPVIDQHFINTKEMAKFWNLRRDK